MNDTSSPKPPAPTSPSPISHDVAVPKRSTPRVLPPISWKHYLWTIGIALLFAAALVSLGPILTPFFAGAILAYLGSPLVEWLSRHKISRTLGTLAVIALLLLVIFILLFVLIPLIQSEAKTIAQRLPEFIDRFSETLLPKIEAWLGVPLSLDMNALRTLATDNLNSLQSVSLSVLSGVKSGGQALLAIVVNLVLIPVVMFYLLRDWNSLVNNIDTLVPRRWHDKTREIIKQIDGVLAEFVRGQALVVVALIIYYVVALWLVGLEFALPIGLLTGLLAFIPYVGFGIGLSLAIIAALLQWSGLPFFFGVLAVYGVGQLLENYVLVPYLVGDRIGLHPLAVIFALLAFGQLFGFVGVLLALPMSAALLVTLRHLRHAYFESPIYRDAI
ncbi:MAG: AI-2E family transporter [Burkholderiales bacterium]|nr:AI-2E family transporter [Burkholderiales bacterium]